MAGRAAGPGRVCRHHGRWSDRDLGIGALKRLSISIRSTWEPRTRRAFSGFYTPRRRALRVRDFNINEPALPSVQTAFAYSIAPDDVE